MLTAPPCIFPINPPIVLAFVPVTVTLPVAKALVIIPMLSPTKPPMLPIKFVTLVPVTFTLAKIRVKLPALYPTRPPI